MITSNQIKALDENELAYLFYCCKSEWDSKNMGYEFDWYILKSFNNKAIHPMLNKYSGNLTDDNKGIIMQILNKLEANI
jgi:hypothetical protein